VTAEQIRQFDPLVKACVRRFASKSLPPTVDRDDLEQTAWQALLLARVSYDPAKNDSLEAWLWLRMRGAILNEIESHRFGKRGEPSETVSFDERDGARDDELTDDEIGLADVMDAFRGLPDRERFVMAGAAVGRSEAEIAADLGLSTRRVRQIKASARCLIRAALRIHDQVAA
jgi:RNA polymerase sigma factor (sigma-70 family)